ncbi:MAG: DUF3788 domain-containing protein [Parabacteroides sp.]|jgi:hypothetical protein|nr:DUF3788 domain-containing protein [Parabacteroides sp.]
MYERMLNKSKEPSITEIYEYIGESSFLLLNTFDETMKQRYDLKRDLKFPFGNNYGWGYKYSHKTKHLCYVFFEKNAITIQLQIGGNLVQKLEKVLPECLLKTKDYWNNRYPCGEGGWIHYRVLNGEELNDVIRLLAIKQKPIFA